MGMQTDKVRFNVGGKIFETSATTLSSARRNSMFGATFDDEWNLQPRQVNEEYFIDRNPNCFSVLLDLLRTGELCVPPRVPDKLFYKEALYYGLLDHVRAARFRELDVNQLRLTSSVRGQASCGSNAIRVSPDGDNIVISACERSGRQDSGIGVFSSSSGNLKHTFQLNHENQVKSFTVGALSFNSDGKMFVVCRGTGINGIGVWDQVTGEETDFFHKTLREPLCNANKIQCFNGSNCLLLFDLLTLNSKKNISVFWILEIKVRFGIIPQ
ncbi:BTB/POZ domain-containing protein At2g24240-like [Papaver somniferum]|uniref:BTB/POZ domain-containing protein At2g24240-like n=1 Tax=Papaver somniferum TaxID=3469 RepID=UPI000E6F76FB|nr:BTB/POZ domain-containing protein At2g24240-like [Papaver somniferum]